jgi:hypothetical protein
MNATPYTFKQLRCSVERGMFSHERAVTCNSRAGEIPVFVPETYVHQQNGSSSVKVRVYQMESAWLAILPMEDQLAIVVDGTDLL